MGEVSIIGIDLAKRSFQVHGAKADGSVAHRRKLSRGKLLSFLPCTVVMEARARRPLLGPGDRGARPRGEAGSPDLREALRQATEERRGGRDFGTCQRL